MIFDNFIYEERMTTVRQTSGMDNKPLEKYISSCKNDFFPEIENRGARVICLLQGVIGIPRNIFLQITRYSDVETYHKIQIKKTRKEIALVENEQVKILTSITSRPKDPFPIDDYRPIYSNRVFYIHKKDIEQCADLSYNKVWPLYEAWGCSVLGLFSSLSFERLHAIKLFAGYKSISHWEETRKLTGIKPDDIDKTLWEEGKRAVFQRAAFTLKSNVSLMRTAYLPNTK